MEDDLLCRFSVWDETQTELFSAYSYEEVISSFETDSKFTIKSVGEEAKLNGQKVVIKNVNFRVSRYPNTRDKVQLIITVAYL